MPPQAECNRVERGRREEESARFGMRHQTTLPHERWLVRQCRLVASRLLASASVPR